MNNITHDIIQSYVFAERKNGVIKQVGVPNSNLTFEVDDYCANSVIKKDVQGICLFFNIDGMKPLFLPLDQSQSLIEALDILEGLSVGVFIQDPLNPLLSNAIQVLYSKLNDISVAIALLKRKVI